MTQPAAITSARSYAPRDKANGVVEFDDIGELLPDGQIVAPHRLHAVPTLRRPLPSVLPGGLWRGRPASAHPIDESWMRACALR
ncbi:DUF5999 family protein [Streptomyces chartreusis]